MPGQLTKYTDAQGQVVPAKYVKAYDKLRDKIARRIAKEWLEEETRLRGVRARTLEAVEQLGKAAGESVGCKALGGKEGYIQFRSFDGSITVRVDNAKRTEFDERLQAAQTLIMEAVREMSADATNADLVEIATRAFQPRTSGQLDMQRIRDLRTYKVSHPKWKQACDIISECERVVGHRRYVRVSVRDAAGADARYINLDIAAVGDAV